MMRLCVLALLLAPLGCAPATPSDGGPTLPPRESSTPAPASEPAASAAPAKAAEPALVGPALDVTSIAPLLADDRFAKAAEAERKGRHADAAREVLAVEGGLPATDGDLRATACYLAGSLFERAGSPLQARAAYRRAAIDGAPTRPVALLRLVEIAARSGEHAEAITLARDIDRSVIHEARVGEAVVESLVRTGALDLARPLYAGMIDGTARPSGWTLVALRLAKALLLKPGEARATEALALARAVMRSGSNGRGADEAEKLVKQAAARLPKAEREAYEKPADAELAATAEALVASNQHKRALVILDRLAKKTLDSEVACKVASARGRALVAVKRTGEGLDELERAADVCSGRPELPEVLFHAGRAAQRASADDRAMRLYGRLESAAPDHRLADDARLEGARAALATGNREAFKRLLAAMPDDYPQGDMTGDGIFLLAVEAMERGAYAEAKVFLERGVARPKERAYQRAGRFTYFLGRARLAAGETTEARALFEQTVRDYPLGYYTALAVARLEQLERGAGRAAVAKTLAEPAASPLPELPQAEGETPAIRAAIAVARASDPRGLDDVLGGLGVKQRTAKPAHLLLAARLYAIAGDQRRAHAVLRTANEVDAQSGRVELEALRDEPPRGPWRAVWQLAYPRLFASEVASASRESGVPEALLFAIMREESAFIPEAVSRSDARGLFQVIPATGAKMARGLGIRFKADTLFDPASAARIGARYLAGLRSRFANAAVLAIPGYNAGPGAPEAWLSDRPGWDLDLWVEKIPYAETRGYTKRVIATLFAYEALYEAGLAETAVLPVRL